MARLPVSRGRLGPARLATADREPGRASPLAPPVTIRAVLFDLDGTLVDSNDLHVRAWLEVFDAKGVHVSAQAVHAQIGKGADLLVPALIPGADPQTADAFGHAHGERFKAAYLQQVRPFPAAHDLLARVRSSGRRVVVASSASTPELDHYLELLGARALVEATTTADDVQTSKPAPDIFAEALRRVDVASDEAVAVGDSPYDVEAAARAGAGTVALRSGGFDDATLQDAGATALYDDVASLLVGFDASPLNG